jgi:hypothetical protein
MVTAGTARLLFVIFVPGELPGGAEDGALALTAERASRFVGGSVARCEVRR